MPFESPNHTQTPNDLFESLMQQMTEAELKVTLAVIRGTLGYHRDGFDCSLRKMTAMTGLSENGVMSGALAAEQRGTIERVNEGHKKTHWRVVFSTSASEARKKRPTSASEAALPQPVRQSTSASEAQSRVKESINKKDKEKELGAKLARPRDPTFDAIAEVCQIDITIRANAQSVGTVRAALASADPPYSAEEVRAWGARQAWRHTPPTVWQLRSEIGAVRGAERGNGHEPVGMAAGLSLLRKKGYLNGE